MLKTLIGAGSARVMKGEAILTLTPQSAAALGQLDRIERIFRMDEMETSWR